MKQKMGLLTLIGLVLFSWSVPAFSADVDSLKRQIDMLADEVDNLKSSGGGSGTTSHDRVSVHGYGEMHFNMPSEGTTTIDNHRFVIGIHAMLTDWIHLNGEIDYEHAAQELEFELGYLDFLLHPGFNVRTGVMLTPVGLLNETHEPNLFWTVERPLLQQRLIPTTWNGGGVGLFGSPMDGVNYRLYVMNSLQSITSNTTSGGSGNGNGGSGSSFGTNGIRGGRGQVNDRIAEDLAVTGRLELTKLYPGLQIGLSTFIGDTSQGFIEPGGRMTLLEADIRYRREWFDMNASVVNIDVDDAAALNAFCNAKDIANNPINANSCAGGIASNNFGWNIQAGIHLPQLLGMKTTHDLVPHFMFERVRTQDEMPSGTDPTESRNRNAVYTFGLTYLPTAAVAIKADHTVTRTGDGKSTDQFNMGIAYMY